MFMQHPKVWRSFILMATIVILSSCGLFNRYDQVTSNTENLALLNKATGTLYYINKSGRIMDIVDLGLSSEAKSIIQSEKDDREKAQKYRDLGEQNISGTKYALYFKIRYYKDRLLYQIEMKPYDETITYKSSTIHILLTDIIGFTLEEIIPSTWTTVVDEKGKKISMSASGSLPMTLDNFMEIEQWSPRWRF
jgi:hypothetical protein